MVVWQFITYTILKVSIKLKPKDNIQKEKLLWRCCIAWVWLTFVWSYVDCCTSQIFIVFVLWETQVTCCQRCLCNIYIQLLAQKETQQIETLFRARIIKKTTEKLKQEDSKTIKIEQTSPLYVRSYIFVFALKHLHQQHKNHQYHGKYWIRIASIIN